jgi:hypothetical protein
MNKKIFLLISCLLLISNVSAWSYDYSKNYGDARAYAQVTGMYPECEGKVHGSYCAGKWYIDVSHQGDKFYISYMISDWPSPSKSGYNLPQIQDGRIYPSINGEVPKFILCAHDYDEADDGSWAWAGICGGYLGNQFLDGKKNVQCAETSDCFSDKYCDKSGNWNVWKCVPKECENGQEKCVGSFLSICENYLWKDKGGNPGKCGYCVNATVDCIKDISIENQEGEFSCQENLCVWNQSFWSKIKLWFKALFSKWRLI